MYVTPRTADEALTEVRRLAVMRRVRIEDPHVRLRMAQRHVRAEDVFCALCNAVGCKPGNELGRWKVTGPDLDGDDLSLVVVFEGDVVVITVM